MRQRALSTWLTTLSVMLGVGLAVAIMILGRESQSLFGQNDYGYDAIIGKKGSKMQLVLNTVYHMDVSPGNIPYDQYTRLLDPHLPKGVPMPADNYFKYVKIAEPTVVGDTLNGLYRIVGVKTSFFGFDEHGDPLKPEDVLDQLYLRAYTRRPSEAEKRKLLALVAAKPRDRQGYDDIFWAILNSSEFEFNH